MTDKPHLQIATDSTELDEVLELPAGASVLSVALGSGSGMMTCPVDVPMCEGAKVALGRDRVLVLVASAGEGLMDLPSVTAAWHWLGENRKLISMALPQMSIDISAAPKLTLLVDHADRRAEQCARVLVPLISNPNVTLRSYRKLRWGGRTGVLLEAA